MALLAQAVGFTPEGRQAPQQVDRQLTRVGVTTAGPGTVLVVRQEPDDGSHLAGEVVTVVQPSRGGADAQPVGAVTSPSGSWVGSVWLSAAAAGEPDPRELLVMGESGALGGTVELQVSTGPSGLFAAGPLKVVTGADLTELGTSSSRPAVWVSGRVGRADLLDLTPLR